MNSSPNSKKSFTQHHFYCKSGAGFRSLYDKNNQRKSFTLIELLIVIAILVILAVVVVLTLNPAELLAQSRDSQRLSDMATLNSAINIYLTDSSGTGFMGTSSVVYVSLPDTASSSCGDLSLPALSAGYTYNCVSSASLVKTDGTGWLPARLASTSSGTPLGSLPKDPTNSSSTGLYYTYITDGSGNYELTAVLESQKYAPQETKDGGPVNFMYESGNKLTLASAAEGFDGIWKFDGNGNDSSGQNNNFTLAGTPLPAVVAGVLGQAYAFNATGSTAYLYATSSTSTTPLGSSPRSMGIWAYSTSTPPSGGYPYLLMGYGTGATDNLFALVINFYQTGGKGVGYGAPALVLQGDDLDSSTAFPLNQWSFVVVTWDGASVKLYLNGQLAGTHIPSGTVNTTPTFPLLVGGDSGAVGSNADMDGYLDEPFILDYALSAAQVQNIYNAEKPH